jgi:hypothetical protein
MHHDLFTATDPALQPLASDRMVPTVEQLRISPWLAMSALQKGIRRADVDWRPEPPQPSCAATRRDCGGDWPGSPLKTFRWPTSIA